jgi:hypothetical protein
MKRIHSLVFGVGIVASLGFGSATAFAEPMTARGWAPCNFYPDEGLCVSCCENLQVAEDYNYNPDTGECLCWV